MKHNVIFVHAKYQLICGDSELKLDSVRTRLQGSPSQLYAKGTTLTSLLPKLAYASQTFWTDVQPITPLFDGVIFKSNKAATYVYWTYSSTATLPPMALSPVPLYWAALSGSKALCTAHYIDLTVVLCTSDWALRPRRRSHSKHGKQLWRKSAGDWCWCFSANPVVVELFRTQAMFEETRQTAVSSC